MVYAIQYVALIMMNVSGKRILDTMSILLTLFTPVGLLDSSSNFRYLAEPCIHFMNFLQQESISSGGRSTSVMVRSLTKNGFLEGFRRISSEEGKDRWSCLVDDLVDL